MSYSIIQFILDKRNRFWNKKHLYTNIIFLKTKSPTFLSDFFKKFNSQPVFSKQPPSQTFHPLSKQP